MYGDTPGAMRALVDVLTGKERALAGCRCGRRRRAHRLLR